MSTLNRLLAAGAVDLHSSESDWRSAIRHAGKLLESAGKITPEYTEAMIESVEEKGPYIVIAPGFAFAHARPSAAVKETSFSWVRLDPPVAFNHKSNDPVDLLVAFAATDTSSHLEAMKELAKLLASKRDSLSAANSEEELREIFDSQTAKPKGQEKAPSAKKPDRAASTKKTASDSVPSKGKILTVCGNGLGTSLFLKNTLDQLLDEWGWSPYLNVEATDTISAKGRAKEADFLLTSGEIAATLGDVGVPVHVIQDFTSMPEIDKALRELYDI